MAVRKLICSVVGHVDHGKSSILDKIRGTSVVAGEAGAITQAIGASIIPLDILKKVCGDLLTQLKMKLTIPGLLFIDTPGHAAFTNLRKRGGSLADIAVLVVDINEGFMPQTMESIEILKAHKTPFVVAANKIDKISGWEGKKGVNLLANINNLQEYTKTELDKKIYQLVEKFYNLGFQAERFDRVADYTKELAIVPVSALTGDGIPELLMVIVGLAQKFLEKGLDIDTEGPAKGVILEVKETKGMGTTLDVILFDGTLRKNDTIVIGGLEKPIVVKVRALLEPAPLAEMREKKTKFVQINEAVAATGVKISAPGIDTAVAGMPIRSCAPEEVEQISEEIQEQVEEVVVEVDQEGLILKADTLGSLEAMITMFRQKNIPIRRATIGDVTKKDVLLAVSNREQDPFSACVLGFSVNAPQDVLGYAKEQGIKIINSQVIYNLLDEYEKWAAEEKRKIEAKVLDTVTRPFKIQLLKGYVFRQNNPAVVGVEILGGVAKSGVAVMKEDGTVLVPIKSMQKEQETISEAKKGDQVAMAFDGITIGRQVEEEEILYSDLPEEDFKKLKEYKDYLQPEEKTILRDIAQIKRTKTPMWGI
ncbi:translation initiation factor IF-2 [Candidatus Woesearchaeota archaeon]|nr:translation initiation factor IF-2 [Candidatus Woesearchaeota archaeon]